MVDTVGGGTTSDPQILSQDENLMQLAGADNKKQKFDPSKFLSEDFL